MKKRKFKEGGMPALEDAAEGKGGRFEKDVYKRALEFRKNVDKEDRGFTPETRKASASPAPAPSPSGVSSGRGNTVGRGADDDIETSSAPAPAPAAKSSRAEIPVDTSLKAPAESDPEGRMGMSDTERNLRNTATALAGYGGGSGIVNRAIRSSMVNSAIHGAQAGRQEAAVAQAAARGAASRAGVQARRAQRQAAEAKAMEEAKPILKARPKKASPRSRTRDEEGIEFSKGGSVRGGGCEQRGKTRGRMY